MLLLIVKYKISVLLVETICCTLNLNHFFTISLNTLRSSYILEAKHFWDTEYINNNTQYLYMTGILRLPNRHIRLQPQWSFWHLWCSSHKIPTATQVFLLRGNEKYTTLDHVSHLLCEASVNLADTEWRIVNINSVYRRYRVMSNLPSGNEEKYSSDMTAGGDFTQEWRLFSDTHRKYWVERFHPKKKKERKLLAFSPK